MIELQKRMTYRTRVEDIPRLELVMSIVAWTKCRKKEWQYFGIQRFIVVQEIVISKESSFRTYWKILITIRNYLTYGGSNSYGCNQWPMVAKIWITKLKTSYLFVPAEEEIGERCNVQAIQLVCTGQQNGMNTGVIMFPEHWRERNDVLTRTSIQEFLR